MNPDEFTFEIEQLESGYLATGTVYDTQIRVAGHSRDDVIERVLERAQERWADRQRSAGMPDKRPLRIVRIVLADEGWSL